MNIRFNYSQKVYLFFIYGLLVIALLSLFFISFYSFYSKDIYKDAKTKSETLCTSVKNSVSTELNNISTISMNIVYSNAIKKNFTSFAKNNTDKIELDNFSVSRENVLSIYDIITAIIGPYQSASQVNLYTLNGISIGSGSFQGVTNVNLSSIPWYDETINKNGGKNISTTTKLTNDIKKNYYNSKDEYLSLTRLFFNSTNEPEGIVEVLQDYKVVFSLISELKSKNPSTSFYVYNEKNELVYPNKSDLTTDINYIDVIKSNNLAPSEGALANLGNNKNVLITYQKIEPYGWTVITSEPKDIVFRSLYTFEQGFIIIIILSIFFTLFLCFVISTRLTYPLSRLTNATKKVTINRVLSEKELILEPVNSNISEITELYKSFMEMYDKLRDSSHEILLLRSEETRAKLQATQSLVNPHFLYNNLTNISIMAEEDMNEDIIKMCHSLCDYFRYITASDETAVPLSEEIFYTEKYIDCMKMRYGDDLIYHSDIHKDTENILIPKLIVQPIVENAFKHGLCSSPPWYLNITSSIDDDKWLIHIEDNGGCLSDEKKEELLSTFHNLNKDKELKNLKIGGMGTKNVYLRLKLLYNENAIFEIDNSKNNKTIFTIGGPIYYNKEDFYGNYTQL
ncbi:sensor histidine kinase [Clostridium sp.]|uniref:cache domain-containing sensor histidine kinase n=1 Tax=Clostridium sp. TaxID=1506 RepID=UPI0026139892|nr:sensor histidine kinase [Clostridium sp.]